MNKTYAYAPKADTFESIRELATKEAWRGITALLNDRPYLVIGKEGEKFVLEGEDGDIQSLESFQWTQATENSRLVSASRHPEVALTKGSIFGQFTVGNLAYENDEWFVRNGDTDEVLPLEWITSRLETLKNDPVKLAWDIRQAAVARFGVLGDPTTVDYRCPMCGSHECQFDPHADDVHCLNCGHIGLAEDFTEEPPENYDDTHGEWYPDFTHEDVNASTKTAATFSMQMPPGGIHLRTHNALGKAGLTGTVQYPPLPGTEYAEGLTGQFPGRTAFDEMDYTNEVEDAGMNPTDVTIQVTVPDGQEEQVRQIIDEQGGATAQHLEGDHMGKVALEMSDQSGAGETDLESENKAVVCPKCGSHTLRSFGLDSKSEAHLKCLTCGNEFQRPAMRNLEARVVESEYHYIRKEGDQYCIWQKSTGKTLSCHASKEQAEAAFRAMETHMHGASDGGKYTPGTRIQMTHQTQKGQRGSIVDFNGKHEDLDEEQYEILLDNGERLGEVPESAFSKIKSARVIDNRLLPNTPEEKFFLDSPDFTFHSDYPGGGDKSVKTIPLTEWDDNSTPDNYDPDVQDGHDFPDEDSDPSCPMCDGTGNSLGALGAREYFRCKNCGMDWSRPSEEYDQWGKKGEDPDNLFGQDKPGVLPTAANKNSSRLDAKGNKLEPGKVYLMSGKNYTVPDLVRILNLEDGRIEAAIASDQKGAFPIIIEASDESDYKFEPVGEKDIKDGDVKEASGWKLARKNYTTKEQRDLIEENLEGRARNFDKLDLSGTHYELKSEAFNDPDFLWG